ncbi:MAG: hypothetical protein AAB674_02625 [Patescibacteria group bacterium]
MRLLKQFLYGFFYLAILVSLIWLVYSFEFKPAPNCFDGKKNQEETGIDCGGSCISCEVQGLKPLSAGSAEFFGDDRVFSAVAEVKNLNADYGTKSFGYEVNFYDSSGRLLISKRGSDFIYSGENKNIIEAGIGITNGIPDRAEIKLINPGDIKWDNKKDFFADIPKLENISAKIENNQIVVSGYVMNGKSLEFSRAIVSAFAVDNAGRRVGVSKTESKIGPFGTWNFNIFIPINKDAIKNIDLNATVKSAVIEALK